MRHRVHKKSFNRDTKARRQLLLGVTTAVLVHGEVITTRAKGKEATKIIERSISRAKVGDLATRRQLHRLFGRRDLVNNLCDRVAPLFQDRQSGFVRMTFIGNRRGDNTPMYRLSLVEALPMIESKKSTPDSHKNKKADTQHTNDSKAREAIKLDRRASQNTKSVANNAGHERKGKQATVSGGRGK